MATFWCCPVRCLTSRTSGRRIGAVEFEGLAPAFREAAACTDNKLAAWSGQLLRKPCINNVDLHIPSMDEPSIQLQLDLNRAVHHELATRRPLLHRLGGSGWVLQIPRPSNAVRHGSRFYYNILVDPCFVEQLTPSNGWFSQPSTPSGYLQTLAALEELLRDLELLASSLRPESSRKSNVVIEDEIEGLETLVDAVVITSSSSTNEDSLRQIQPNTPVFTTQDIAPPVEALQHFRTLGTISEFGEGGCNDWRSTTAIAGLPEWVGLSKLPKQDDDADQHLALMVAFNNQHYNSSARLNKPIVSIGSSQKRHAAIVPNEDEDFAEAVLFTTQGISSENVSLLSNADPTIHSIALIGRAPDSMGHPSLATYHIAERNVVIDKGKGFLAWLIAKARFNAQTSEASKSRSAVVPSTDAESHNPKSHRSALGKGETKVLI